MERRRLADILASQQYSLNRQYRFQAAFAMPKGSLKRLRRSNRKSGYGGDTPCSVSGCINGWAA